MNIESRIKALENKIPKAPPMPENVVLFVDGKYHCRGLEYSTLEEVPGGYKILIESESAKWD